MSSRLLALSGLALISATIPAAAAAPEAAAPGWTVDHAKSNLGFAAISQGEDFEGKFNDWAAEIHFDPANLAASMADVTIALGSVETGDPSKDTSLPEDDWFATALFPEAKFTTSEISSAGDGSYLAKGTLTIRGVSQPVTLPFTLTITDDTAEMHGSVTINRIDFGVGKGAWSSDSSVGHQISVNVDLVANKAG